MVPCLLLLSQLKPYVPDSQNQEMAELSSALLEARQKAGAVRMSQGGTDSVRVVFNIVDQKVDEQGNSLSQRVSHIQCCCALWTHGGKQRLIFLHFHGCLACSSIYSIYIISLCEIDASDDLPQAAARIVELESLLLRATGSMQALLREMLQVSFNYLVVCHSSSLLQLSTGRHPLVQAQKIES